MQELIKNFEIKTVLKLLLLLLSLLLLLLLLLLILLLYHCQLLSKSKPT